MITWGELKERIRVDTRDTAASPRLSDELALVYYRYAVNHYSRWNPYAKELYADLEDSNSFDAPLDMISSMPIITVEAPLHRFLIPIQQTPGHRYQNIPGLPMATQRLPTTYYRDSGKIWLNLPFTGRVRLKYRSVHPCPPAANQNEFILTIPDEDEQIINLGIRAFSSGAIRGRQANLDRFSDDGSVRKNNPMAFETSALLKSFEEMIEQKYSATGSVILTRNRSRGSI